MPPDLLYALRQTGIDSIGLLLGYEHCFPERMHKSRVRQAVYPLLKRALDVVLSALGLVLLAPLFLLLAAAIRLDSKGRAIYAQERIGKDGKPFVLYKFRSMTDDAHERLGELLHLNEMDGPAFKMKHDPRVTRVGRFIRRTSMDELPQLLNILRGEMSLVGPRPPLLCEVERYTPYQKKRLSALPGLTCYWQISARRDIRFDEWVEMDLDYIRKQSILLDISLIFKTLPVILTGRGI